MDVAKSIQDGTAAKERTGQFIRTTEETYFTDECPEYKNKPGDRFVMGEDHQNRREHYNDPYISPVYYREIVTTIVTRHEITAEEYREENPLGPHIHSRALCCATCNPNGA